MKRALLLNANYEPLHFVSDRDAIVLYYRGSAEIVSNDGVLSQWEETFNSPSTIIKIPATLRLLKHFRRKWKRPRFQKKVLSQSRQLAVSVLFVEVKFKQRHN